MDNIATLILVTFVGCVALFLTGCVRRMYYAPDPPSPDEF
jgi:hypothetical protein